MKDYLIMLSIVAMIFALVFGSLWIMFIGGL